MIEIELFTDVETALENITPDAYVRPEQNPLRGVKKLGPATDRMKQLYTLHALLGLDEAMINRFLSQNGVKGNEQKFRELNQANLQKRAVVLALGDEVGREFDAYGERYGIDCNWDVYAPK